MSILTLKEVGKKYGGHQVLQGINMELAPGEIHGLVGENGAGKSTLMNILFGMPVIQETGGYEGEILIDGQAHHAHSPMEAMNAGLGMVHQEFMLIPGFTIRENVKLNREITKENWASRLFGKNLRTLDEKTMAEETKAALDKLDLDLDENQLVEGLPVGFMQFVEIVREIDKKNLKLLILDEPTAVLTETEAKQFLEIIKRLAGFGIAILFITHRLDEIKAVTDRITVLRDGKVVAVKNTADVSVTEIARLMVGREVEVKLAGQREFPEDSEIILSLENFSSYMPGEVIRNIDLQVRKGEILGIGGLAGQGKIGLANGIMGLYEAEGSVRKNGVELPLNQPKKMLAEGIAFLSEDRKEVGLLLEEAIDFNIAYTSMEVRGEFLKKRGPISFVDHKKIRENGERLIEELDIRCRTPHQQPKDLSGGNQQKVCIARALTFNPDILMISEPTRGIDIGAKELVLDTLVRLNREEGMTIIITSSELKELKQIADRIAIITEGKIQGILPADADDALFGLAMSGESIEEEAWVQ